MELYSSRPLPFGGRDTTRVRRPKPRTARVPGPEGGPGPEEGVRGRRRPARRAVRPAYPERGGAGARRSRRRGRSRLQEPLETESPAAAAVAGGAHRQASGHRAGTERRAQVASLVPAGTGAQRGASAGQFGGRLRVPGAGKRDGGREGKGGRKGGGREECPGGRGLVGALGAGEGDGGGRAGEGRRDREADCALALDGRRLRRAGAPRG